MFSNSTIRNKVAKFLLSILLATAVYALVLHPIIKVIIIDVLNIHGNQISKYEWLGFLIITLGIARYTRRIFFKGSKVNKELSFSYPTESFFMGGSMERIEEFINTNIDGSIAARTNTYLDIDNRSNRTVYTIIGGWRSGKTTISAVILEKLRAKYKEKILSETYHDTFNFGNINESIATFFEEVSRNTEIDELAQLGALSTPSESVTFNLGALSINKKAIGLNANSQELKRVVFDKLTAAKGYHIIILDDIDRLNAEEQLQWLRTIELLGKFDGRLLIFVPINIKQLELTLIDSGTPITYLDKILPHRLKVGVDIDYIKYLLLPERANKEQKALYSIYIYSLAIRMVIQYLRQNKGVQKSRWRDLVNNGYVSEILNEMRKKLEIKQLPDANTEFMGEKYGFNEYLFVNEGRQLYKNTSFQSRIQNYFVSDMTQIIDESDINLLQSTSSLAESFERFHYAKGTQLPAEDSSEWKDFWLDYGYRAVKDIESDDNISNYFNYDDIVKDIRIYKHLNTYREKKMYLIKKIIET